MAARRKRKPPASPPAARRKPARQTPPRAPTIPLLLGFAGLVVVGAVALLVLRPGGGGTEANAWATLNTADVHALTFAPGDPAHLYFGHHNGLLESRDGGRTWQPSALSGADAMNVRTAGTNRIQIAGHEVYLESADGGTTWQAVPNDLPGLDLHAYAVDPADPDHAWTFAVGFGLFETRDAGRHWDVRQSGNWPYLASYRSGEKTVLVAVGPEGLARSVDGGATWQSLDYPGAPLAGGMAAADDGSVLYAATSDGLRRSTDQGQTWSDTGFDGVALALAVAPGDPMTVALVDEATRFYRSEDGGTTWPPP